LSGRRALALELVSYVIVAVLVLGWTPLTDAWTVSGAGADLAGTLWIHWWVGESLGRMELPIRTDLLFHPDGKNFFHDTGANYVDAVIGWPLQWIFGVPGFLDPLNLLILVGNGLAFAALARDFTEGRRLAAWAAAIAFMVNPFVLTELAEGRPTQALLWFVILAVRHAVRLERGRIHDAARFGVYTALAALTYWYTAYFIALALLPLLLAQLLRAPGVVGPRLALAVGITLGMTAPFLVGIAEALDAGAVTRLQHATWGDGPAGSATRWRTVMSDFGSATWLAALAVLLGAWRQTPLLLAGILCVMTLAVGARLDVTDPPLLNHGFIFLWDNLPLLTRLGFPDRAMCLAFILLGVGAALGLTRVDGIWSGLFAAVAIGEIAWRGTLPLASTTYGESPCANEVARQGGPVIHLPLGSSEISLVLQTAHGQPTLGGMGERDPDLRPEGYEARLDNPFVINLGATLHDRQPAIAYTRADRDAIASRFRWVWLELDLVPPSWRTFGYDPAAARRQLERELGSPVIEGASCVVFDLRGPIPADAPGLAADAQPASDALRRLGVSDPSGALGVSIGGTVPPDTRKTPPPP
jgi:hypothetical protein